MHSKEYKTSFPKAGWAEQSPQEWWNAMGEAVKGVIAKADNPEASNQENEHQKAAQQYGSVMGARRSKVLVRFPSDSGHDASGRRDVCGHNMLHSGGAGQG